MRETARGPRTDKPARPQDPPPSLPHPPDISLRPTRSARGPPARRRAASTARARPPTPGRSRRRAAGPRRVAGVQGAVAAAAGVGDAAPVDRLEAGLERDDEVAGVRRGQRRPDPRQRVGVGLAAQPAVVDGRLQRQPSSPSSSQRAAAQVGDARRRAGSAAARRRARPPPTRRPPPASPARAGAAARPSASCSRQTRSTPSISVSRARDRLGVGPLALARQQVDVGGAAGRADRQLGQLGVVVGGLQDRPLAAEQLGQRQAAVDRRSGRGRRPGSPRARRGRGRAHPPASTSFAKQSSALAIDSTLASGPWRCE